MLNNKLLPLYCTLDTDIFAIHELFRKKYKVLARPRVLLLDVFFPPEDVSRETFVSTSFVLLFKINFIKFLHSARVRGLTFFQRLVFRLYFPDSHLHCFRTDHFGFNDGPGDRVSRLDGIIFDWSCSFFFMSTVALVFYAKQPGLLLFFFILPALVKS